MSQKGDNSNQHSATAEKVRLKKPPLYVVLILNDDYTPMEFVVHVLMKFFQKNQDQATELMLSIHKTGQAVAGTFEREIAETKAARVIQYAQEHEFPLQSRIAPA
jgi:ATP-dependent Clp protease adaptor protein ClpS